MTINERLEALEEKFDNDNDEQAFVDGVLEVVYSDDFGYEVLKDNVHSDTICFSWKQSYNPVKDEYDGEYIDLDEQPFDAVGVSEENKKRVNDAIRKVVEDEIEIWEDEARESRIINLSPWNA